MDKKASKHQAKSAATKPKDAAERIADLKQWMADDKNVDPIHHHATCNVFS